MRVNDGGGDDHLDLSFYWGILRHRVWLIIGSVILFAALGVALSAVQQNIYEATAQVVIQRQASDQVFSPTTSQIYDPNRNVQTEVKILESQTVEKAAVQRLGHSPNITIGSDSTSDVVEVVARSASAAQAAVDANVYAKAYVDYRTKTVVQSLVHAGEEVQAQIEKIDLQLLSAAESDKGALEDQRAYLVQQLGRLQISQNLADSGGAQIVAKADLPTSPVSPKPARNGLIGAALGLLVGVGLAFLLEYLDDDIDDRAELERAVEGAVPVVGEIPSVSGWKKKEGAYLVTREAPDSSAAEAYRTLRTAVQFLGIDGELRSIQITSARAEEGKTTTLANLAFALARAGLKVGVVCGDLRRPRVHEFFGLSNQVGLTSVLLGDATLAEAVQRVPSEPRLALLASGPVPPNPSELLASPRVNEILGQLERVCDVVLFDSPPVLPVSDAMVIAGLVDATFLVAFAGESSRRALHRSYELLRQVNAHVVGLVLNNAESESSRYGYGHYRHRPAQSKPAKPTKSAKNSNGAKNGVKPSRRRRSSDEDPTAPTLLGEELPAQSATWPANPQ